MNDGPKPVSDGKRKRELPTRRASQRANSSFEPVLVERCHECVRPVHAERFAMKCSWRRLIGGCGNGRHDRQHPRERWEIDTPRGGSIDPLHLVLAVRATPAME